MARVITWVKQQRYQWVREDFHKAYGILMCGLVMFAVVGGITLFFLVHFGGVSRDSLLVAVAIGYMFLFATIGGAFALKWADGKLKS